MNRLPRQMRLARPGLTCVELLVVLAMVAMLIALLFPAVYAAQQRDAALETQNNLKQLGLALHAVNDTYKLLPPAYGTIGNRKKQLEASLHVHILPYIEQETLYRKYLTAEGKEVDPVVVPSYVSKLDPSLKKKEEKNRKGIQNFPANLRVFADSGRKTGCGDDMPKLRASEPGTARIPATFRDGTSNTMVFATKYAYCGAGGSRYASRPNTKTAAFFGQNAAKKKADPADKTATFQLMPSEKQCLCSPLMAQSYSKDSIFVGLADASVRSVNAKVSPVTWNSALHPSDGHDISDDW